MLGKHATSANTYRGGQRLVCAGTEQALAHCRVTLVGGIDQRCPAIVIREVNIGATLDEHLDQLLVALLRGHQQRAVALIVGCKQGTASTALSTHSTALSWPELPLAMFRDSTFPACITCIHVGASLEQQLDELHMLIVHSVVQRGPAIMICRRGSLRRRQQQCWQTMPLSITLSQASTQHSCLLELDTVATALHACRSTSMDTSIGKRSQC